jgi:hypothetical protein
VRSRFEGLTIRSAHGPDDTMAANTYYDTHIGAAHEQQQHLLAHASPLSDQFSQPATPLKKLHLVSETNYYHGHSQFEKHSDLNNALHEDAVRQFSHSIEPTLIIAGPQITHPPFPHPLPRP